MKLQSYVVLKWLSDTAMHQPQHTPRVTLAFQMFFSRHQALQTIFSPCRSVPRDVHQLIGEHHSRRALVMVLTRMLKFWRYYAGYRQR
eukprot:SAG31_NODE_5491_length_2504_cov_1.442412_1_plen_87_part_10